MENVEVNAKGDGPTRIMAKAKPKPPFTGRWHIVSMTGWDDDRLNEEGQAYIEFDGKGRGSFQFGDLHGQLDYRTKQRNGQRAVQFCWDGDGIADRRPLSGIAWAVLEGDEPNGYGQPLRRSLWRCSRGPVRVLWRFLTCNAHRGR